MIIIYSKFARLRFVYIVDLFVTLCVSVIPLSCEDGYRPQVPYEFQCLASLRWSGTPPVCHPVTCGAPPIVENAVYTLQENTYLSTVTYTCSEGYRYGYITSLSITPSDNIFITLFYLAFDCCFFKIFYKIEWQQLVCVCVR